jgi:hypothetical protein
MKKITLLLVMLCILPCAAQMAPTGNLTIFSEDGAKFFLELNGERYNDVAQTNVRVEELPNPYYSCKIVFADATQPALVKKTLSMTDVDDIMQDVTYRIKTDGRGKRNLSFYSSIPAEQNMIRPKNVPVYRYGAPNVVVAGTDTVYTTESVTVQQSAGMNVNMGGVQMSVSIPADVITTTTTTSSSSVSSSGNFGSHQGDDEDRPGRGGCRYAMSARDFEDAKATITQTTFEDTKQSSAKSIISANCLTTTQVLALVKLFTFEQTKIDIAKYAYAYCIDKNNYFKVVNAFTFDASKAELNEYIQQQR